MHMRIGSAMWHRLASSVIPVAVVAALPLVQWCSVCAGESSAACPVERAAVTASMPSSEAAACANGAPACEHGALGGQCPFAGAPHRLFCVGEPMGGPGVRPHAPELATPALQ